MRNVAQRSATAEYVTGHRRRRRRRRSCFVIVFLSRRRRRRRLPPNAAFRAPPPVHECECVCMRACVHVHGGPRSPRTTRIHSNNAFAAIGWCCSSGECVCESVSVRVSVSVCSSECVFVMSVQLKSADGCRTTMFVPRRRA